MFKTIVIFELKYWLRQPAIYVYSGALFLVSMFLMQGVAGGWDPPSLQNTALPIENSPLRINWQISFFSKIILFLVPATIGLSLYRDFHSGMHTLLYAYPFRKRHYLPAKFLSSLSMLFLVVLCIGLGTYAGTRLPGLNPAKIGPFIFDAYAQAYLVYVLPNLIFFGAAVFAAVAFTRNIYAGFIVVILFFFLQGLTQGFLSSLDHEFLAALLDPFGRSATDYFSRYWTLAEKNVRMLPVTGLVLCNRLIWLGLALLILAVVYQNFAFSQTPVLAGFIKKKPRKDAQPAISAGQCSATIQLSAVRYDFSPIQRLKSLWRLSAFELGYILKSGLFISVLAAGILMVLAQQAQQPLQHGFKILPVTWKMLRIPTFLFSTIISLLTFLYAGMLVQRAATAQTAQLVDATPMPNWVLLFSKWLALVKMQLLLVSLIMICGIAVQAANGYYHFEIGHYLFELFLMNMPGFMIWAMAALFVQTLVNNPYLGLFLLIMGVLGIAGLPDLGLQHYVFRFNLSPEMRYSDMNGYGHYLKPFYLYKLYWMLAGCLLLGVALLFWQRGLSDNFRERLRVAGSRFSGITAILLTTLLLAFLGMGAGIYYVDEMVDQRVKSAKEARALLKVADQKYERFIDFRQPRIVSVNINLDIFPASNDFRASGFYWLVNKTDRVIDTLLVSRGYDEISEYTLDRDSEVLIRDRDIQFDVLKLTGGLNPGDSLRFSFNIRNTPNTFLRRNSNILQNGTFIGNDFLPRFYYRSTPEVAHPSDSSARGNHYGSKDSDWIDFEAIVSTAADQIAIAPGYLQKEWREEGRRYFHYKMDQKIKFYFGFNSGRFAVLRDSAAGTDLEIYYHKGHGYNIERMMHGLKAALDYNAANFSPYQHRQARIIEFAISEGTHATTFANSIPFSEYRFISDNDPDDRQSFDMPFYVAVHELSHQWWGNQVLPAYTLGSKMITESLSEYTALKVLEKEMGKGQLRQLLKLNRHNYLRGRAGEKADEKPLLYCRPEQQYIAYARGALAFHALGEHIGEENLNKALREYIDRVGFQNPPYTTSLELLAVLQKVTPADKQYLLKDMFETVTLYNNRIVKAAASRMVDGRYKIDLSLIISKYRTEGGRRIYEDRPGEGLRLDSDDLARPVLSLPLSDYIEIAVFGEPDDEQPSELHLEKFRFDRIDNHISIIVDQEPRAIEIDPFFLVLDADKSDDRQTLAIK